ncbi:hypothetical protein BMF94_1396 [Rhodotorula taiwanensis]|uniref:Glycosyl transferase 64 domain-containing protein n=1 Tax=Rhodotorula taiwanensis TaxID=741276 RepID=A0A2S5BFF1_9BASI|nr:hypothetical protein BMF94_1396 [Rhodotorula taiwanensis]
MPPRRRTRAFVGVVFAVCALWGSTLLWRRSEAVEEKRTVVLTAYETQGLRPAWLRQIVEQYASDDYADLIDAILLVWNAPEEEPPSDLPAKVQVIRAAANSLNNRWLLTPEYAQPGPVIVLDNDLLLSKSGIRCLQAVQRDHPDRLIGPYVRRREDAIYVLDELMSRSSPYNFVLPRALIGHTELLDLYRNPELAQLHAYVDEQEAHCDDLLLNLAVSNTTGVAPLRVALPPSSVRDFATYCSPLDRAQSAGLADQTDRWKYRTECLQHLLSQAGFSTESSPEDEDVALCSQDGESYDLVSEVGLPRWRSMSTARAIDLCPELVPERDLAAESRLGLGRELVEYCPELDPGTTEWIDALIDKPLCGDGGAIQDPHLLASAKHQCGAWCMWDLRVRGKTGWRLTGSCFERFEGGHPECDKWFYQRPHMHL